MSELCDELLRSHRLALEVSSFIHYTIQDPEEIRGLISKMIASASEEIQILFPSSNVLEIYWNEGLLSLLKEKAGAGKKNMIIRILVKKDDLIHQLIIRLFSQLENVQPLQSDSKDAKVVTMIVDKDCA